MTNITVPLLGLVDTTIVGHMGSAVYMAAIAVGSMVFNLVYWVFGFLRMGTSGMTAQAYGRHDFNEVTRLLVRSGGTSLSIALAIIVLQIPLRELMLWFIGPTADVRPLAVSYFNIVVWGAPAVLGLYGLSGWFIGMQNTRFPMFISIFQNVVNILASLTLVYGFGMKVEGVATGTVIAQYAGLAVALALLWQHYRRIFRGTKVRETKEHGNFLRVNSDIFLRTLCLVAVNTVLMQLYLLFSYIMDGFAYAGEALGGRYWGAGDMPTFHGVVRRLFGWGVAMTVLFTIVYIVGGQPFLGLLTDESAVITAAAEYIGWAWLIPAAGMAAFVWDGIFIGITQTRGMLLSSTVAAVVFFACAICSMQWLGNHGLWLAMVLFLLTRGVVQTIISLVCTKEKNT